MGIVGYGRGAAKKSRTTGAIVFARKSQTRPSVEPTLVVSMSLKHDFASMSTNLHTQDDCETLQFVVPAFCSAKHQSSSLRTSAITLGKGTTAFTDVVLGILPSLFPEMSASGLICSFPSFLPPVFAINPGNELVPRNHQFCGLGLRNSLSLLVSWVPAHLSSDGAGRTFGQRLPLQQRA